MIESDNTVGTTAALSETGLAPMSISLTDNDDYYLGTPADEHIIGRRGDDRIVGNGGADSLAGWGGDDELISYGSGGRLTGNQGNDYLEAKKTSYGQYHLYGGDGDDTFVMHLDNNPGWGHQGFHAFGGDQSDEFRFVGVGTTLAPLMARIQDFDVAQDSIWVDDVEIDLSSLPSNMRIVNYYDQQWLVIGDNIMIGLEGARKSAPPGVPTMMGSNEEMHFHAFPTNLADLPSVEFAGGTLDLKSSSNLPQLSYAQFVALAEIYVAYFNRAPDALGLNFWGAAIANGMSLEEIAALFMDQDETRATYPSSLSNTDFATVVYNNVLGRAPDQAGLDFWVSVLDAGVCGRDKFILSVLEAVQVGSSDRLYLDAKIDIGAYFAVYKGMSDVDNTSAAMALFDGAEASIDAPVAAINSYYVDALDPMDGTFLMPVVGVLDNPFAMA